MYEFLFMKIYRIKKTLLILILSCLGGLPSVAQINTDKVLAIGRNALYFEDYVLSIQYFNQVIKSRPHLAEPYFYRALAKFNLDDYVGAENDFTLCLERNPFWVYAYQYRGAARQNLENFKGAIEDYEKGLEFRPEDKQMLLNQAIAYAQLDEYDTANETLDLLIKYQSKYMYAYLARGSVFLEKGDTIKALDDYNYAIELDKYYAPAYAQRGMLYLQKENYESALSDFDQAIYLEIDRIGFYINRGLTRYYLNDLRGSMADYDKAVTLDPNNQIARFNRGLLRTQVSDVYGALEDFDKVIEQEPDNYLAIYNRAYLNEEVGNNQKAIRDLDMIIQEYPNFIPAYYFRSNLKRKTNDLRGADKDYWYAYDLEKELRKLREQGKVVTGKEVYDSEEIADTEKNNKTREQSDQNIEKFNRLVVYDKEEETQSKYNNEIRGRVQDKQVKVELEPQFVITYYEQLRSIDNAIAYLNNVISDYNNNKILSLQLKIVNNEVPLTDAQADFHFQSINNLSLIIDQDSTNVDAYFARSLDFMVLQDLSETIEDLNKIIRLNPGFVMAFFNRAVTRQKQMEINKLSNKNTDINTLSLQITKASNSFTQQTGRETMKIEESNNIYELNLIKDDYDRVIKLNPDFVYAYFNKGNIFFQQKDYQAAMKNYDEAISRNSDFAEAYFNKGLTQLYLGEKEKGIQNLSKAGELGLIKAYNIIKKMTWD